MPTTSYITANGMMLGEVTNGIMRNYGTDALGSVVQTYSNGALENTYAYKPYGATLAKTGTAADPSFLWNGGSGYRAASPSATSYYVRRRHFSTAQSQWSTSDPAWPQQHAYGYSLGRPVVLRDPSGLFPQACNYNCGFDSPSVMPVEHVCEAKWSPFDLTMTVRAYLAVSVWGYASWSPDDKPGCCSLNQYVMGYQRYVVGSVTGPKIPIKDKIHASLTEYVYDQVQCGPPKPLTGGVSFNGFDAPGIVTPHFGGENGLVPPNHPCPVKPYGLTSQTDDWPTIQKSYTVNYSFLTCVTCTGYPDYGACRPWTLVIVVTLDPDTSTAVCSLSSDLI
jgi:RHS repeat-associated protein